MRFGVIGTGSVGQIRVKALKSAQGCELVQLCNGKNGTIADGFAGFRAVEIANAIYRSTVEKQTIRLVPPF